MKKTIYGIFSLLLFILLVGCTQDEIVKPNIQLPDGGSVMVRFSAVIPEYNTVQTRANGGVDDMHVLVFDQNGTFITREPATLTNQTNAGGTFEASLPSSSSSRIVHFICNYNWDGFSNASKLGLNEAAVVGLLSTTNATFWARRELPDGINIGSFPASNPIELLRNQAKISVSNNEANFTLQGFTIHNTPNMSSVAPFNTATASFEEGAITEPIGMGLNSALQADISSTEKYLFERRNRAAAEITTVIVQGMYEGTSYFYKIDLIDSTQVRYNIERNYHYMVKIETVTKEGYTSFTDALEGASHNNTALDPIIEKYPIISDGVSKLVVEKTLIVVTEPNKVINVWAKYYPTIGNNDIDNSEVTVTLFTNEGALVDGSLAYNATTGIITATSAPTLGTEPLVALIRVQKDDLARTIRIVLRTPFLFDPIRLNDRNPGQLFNAQNMPANLKFFIPVDFPVDLLPLPVKIHTQGLYPSVSGLQMFVEGGLIHYVYMATTTGTHILNLKTNKAGNAETVTLTADYFIDGAIDYDIVQYNGAITYGTSNTAIPMGATVTASTGTMQVTAAGQYLYTPPPVSNNNTPVTLTYYQLINTNTNSGVPQSFENGYKIATTVGALDNGAINLPIDHFRIIGRIKINWQGSLYNIYQNTLQVSTSNASTTNITINMLSNDRYEVKINGDPSDTETISISSSSPNRTYSAIKDINTLRTNQYYELRN